MSSESTRRKACTVHPGERAQAQKVEQQLRLCRLERHHFFFETHSGGNADSRDSMRPKLVYHHKRKENSTTEMLQSST
jgi:hypothetical protein